MLSRDSTRAIATRSSRQRQQNIRLAKTGHNKQQRAYHARFCSDETKVAHSIP